MTLRTATFRAREALTKGAGVTLDGEAIHAASWACCLLPARPRGTQGYDRVARNQGGSSSWGGSVVEDDGVYHMFAAEMDMHCGINLWYPNSMCVRAASPSAEGPYTLQEVVVPRFCHEPVVVHDPSSKRWLLFHVGAGVGEDKPGAHNCSAYGNGTTDCTQGPGCEGGKDISQDKPGVLSSESLLGPWEQIFIF